MAVSDFIDWRWLLAAFAVGLLIVYMTAPAPRVVVRFPNPDTAGKTTYRDASGACFTYDADAVPCTTGAKEQPIAEDQEAFTRYAPIGGGLAAGDMLSPETPLRW